MPNNTLKHTQESGGLGPPNESISYPAQESHLKVSLVECGITGQSGMCYMYIHYKSCHRHIGCDNFLLHMSWHSFPLGACCSVWLPHIAQPKLESVSHLSAMHVHKATLND